jgi:hypothetical protein
MAFEDDKYDEDQLMNRSQLCHAISACGVMGCPVHDEDMTVFLKQTVGEIPTV